MRPLPAPSVPPPPRTRPYPHPPTQRGAPTSTLELGVVDAGEFLAAHAVGRVTARAARLDGVRVQVLGQPLQVTVADERVPSQVPVKSNSKNNALKKFVPRQSDTPFKKTTRRI